MRIVFLLEGFLHYTSQLANALVECGADVTIVARSEGWDFVGSGSGDVKQDYLDILHPSINVEWVHVPSDTNPKTIGANLKSILHLAGAIRKHRPDVLHVMDVADYRFLAATVFSKRKYPIVLTVHDASMHPGDTPNRMEFMRPYLRKTADAILVHGEDVERKLLEQNVVRPEKVYRVPRGPYTMYKQWKTGASDTEHKNVLFFGRVRKYKGLDQLIAAAPAVYKAVPEARFIIAGSGPDWQRCRSLIKNPEYFELHEEKISDPKVTALFERSSIVVLPYLEASQSGVLFIAYALGRPVIVTRVGCLPEVVEEGKTGLVIPPGDVDALSKAIIYLLKNNALRAEMGRNAETKVMTGDLSWGSIARKTAQIYENVLCRKRDGHDLEGEVTIAR